MIQSGALRFYRFAVFCVIFAAGVYLNSLGFFEYVTNEWEEILELTQQHLFLVGVSMAIATALGLGVGILLTRQRFRKFAPVVMYIVGLGQTVPSLAVLALSRGILGIGTLPGVVALTIYSILPVARNTLAGIQSVPSSMLDAAKGMGMAPLRILWEVELPNAMLVIITGIRVALVINVGTAALGYLIGAGGLGDPIFSGISLMMPEQMLAGAVPTALLALAADFLVELAIPLVVPRGLRLSS